MKQSKIGMIGCGMISEVYAKNITERFRFLYKGIIINHNKNRANLH